MGNFNYETIINYKKIVILVKLALKIITARISEPPKVNVNVKVNIQYNSPSLVFNYSN